MYSGLWQITVIIQHTAKPQMKPKLHSVSLSEVRLCFWPIYQVPRTLYSTSRSPNSG